MPEQTNRGQLFIFLLLMLYFMSSAPPQDAGYPPPTARKRIMKEFQGELEESRKSLAGDYEQGYGNLTGFRLSYHDAILGRNLSDWPFSDHLNHPYEETEEFSILPNVVSRRARDVWNTESRTVELPNEDSDTHPSKHRSGVYHQNVTGYARGTFHKEKISLVPIQMEVPAYYDKLREYKQIQNEINFGNDLGRTSPFEDDEPDHSDTPVDIPVQPKRPGNITAVSGITKFSMYNTKDEEMAESAGETTAVDLIVTLNDNGEHDEQQVSLSGLYHIDNGNLVATTRSAKFAGIYALPHLNLGPGKHFNSTRELYLLRSNRTAPEDITFSFVDQLLEDSASCEYVAYLHFESTDMDLKEIHQIDDELTNPMGRPHRVPPKLRITGGVLYSPDCGIMLDLDPAEGPRNEVYTNDLRRTIIFLSFIVLAQIILFVNQMNVTNTPSTLSRISFWTLALINVADGSFSMIALLCSMIFKDLYLQFVFCAFLAFTCCSIFEMKYNIMVYSAQINERPITWRTALQGTPLDERTEEGNETTPAITAPTPQPQDDQTIAAQLYTRYFCTLIFLFFGLSVTTWPIKQRRVFEYITLTVFNSYWFPQIYRNVIRGSRKSFTWQFILGTSIIRLAPIAYACIFPNPFYHHPDYMFVVFLSSWIAIQLFALFLQEILGPRFFLPERYLPKTYKYHPLLTKGDLENGYNFESFVDSDQPPGSTLKCKLDCTICMQSLEIPVIDNTVENTELHESMASNARNLMATRAYMVTPCRHIFHTECLEGWMRYKLQCPVCRNSLPPL
ncbi:hypothetical protein FOA43_001265 [Brettanomyces nanus]|uniref:RING-type E3 ubiquitin transferase n=1 Tax=Eeniella nana TaxID=13502 RepID=A0A875RNN4_EENNA|nr:uncharacterized protein FOA43_001265 [Brettanomyces nanus]QPG73950.1 hypothetical protein FOA43_001265 [Brettanomyces nanus]